jgi:hypothetical protein
VVVETLHSGPQGVYPGAKTLEAISSDRTVDRLSAPAKLLNTFTYHWSLVGDMLTSWVVDCCARTPVYWWNLATNTHGMWKTPSADARVIGSSPDGWLYVGGASGSEQIVDEPANGSAPISLGNPDPGKNIDGWTTGPDGFVVGADNGVSFRLWFSKWQSSTFTALDGVPKRLWSHAEFACDAEAFHAVACYYSRRNDDDTVLRIPTSGAPATSTPTSVNWMFGVALTATRTGWVGMVNPPTHVTRPAPPAHLYTALATTTARVTRSAYPVYPDYPSGLNNGFVRSLQPITSAFGRFVVAASPADDTRLATTRSASSALTTLLPASPATVHASAVSLRGRTVTYADDQHEAQGDDVFTRTLGLTPGARPGKATEVLSTSGASAALIGSRSTVASVTIVGVGSKTHFVTHVIDGQRRMTLTGTAKQYEAAGGVIPYFSVSEHWVLFTHGARARAWILDAATGKSRPAHVPTSQPAVLTGGRIAFQKPDGSVWSRPLTGGTAIRLFKAPKRLQFVNATLTAGGDFVAAYYTDDPEDDPVPGPFLRYRRINGVGPIHTRSHREDIIGANDKGLLVSSGSVSWPFETDTTQLMYWTSHRLDTLLTETYNVHNSGSEASGTEPVSVWGHRIVWIDPRGQVHAATWR